MEHIDTSTYTYIQSSSLVANITYPNNITVNYTYKPQTNLIASVENKHSTTTISKYSYTYNHRDQRIKVTLADGSYWEYTYDEMGQLTSAIKYDSSGNAIPGHTFDYNFDTIGNRKSADISNELLHYTSNELNQYTQITDGDTISLSYDDDGNLLYDGRFTYTWNGENRLIRVETTGSAKPQLGIEFSYDYKGRRIEKKVYENGVLTKHELFVYDGFKCIEKLDALNGNSLLQKFIWYGEKILSVTTDSDTYYYLHDANKNVYELIDGNGNIVAHYEYSPFGKVITSTGSYASENPYRFSSEYSDDETALIYYNYRYYSPEHGRWLSRDPISEQGGVNLYCFILNSPISLHDILGIATKKQVIQGIIDAMTSGGFDNDLDNAVAHNLIAYECLMAKKNTDAVKRIAKIGLRLRNEQIRAVGIKAVQTGLTMVDIGMIVLPTPGKFKMSYEVLKLSINSAISKNPEKEMFGFLLGMGESKLLKKFLGESGEDFLSYANSLAPNNPVVHGNEKLKDIFQDKIQQLQSEYTKLMKNIAYYKVDQFKRNSLLGRMIWGKYCDRVIGIKVIYNHASDTGIAEVTNAPSPTASPKLIIRFFYQANKLGGIREDSISIIELFSK